MARTWGELRFEISKFAPGVDLQLVNQWLNAAYREVLDHYAWKGLEKEAILQTVAPYTTGTVTVTSGSTAVTGAGTVWTSAMTGRSFRVDGRSEFYSFTRTGNTTGTLDRAYEGDTAAGAAYHIFQAVYELPRDVKYIQTILNRRLGREIVPKTRVELERLAPTLATYGEPQCYAPVADTPEDAPPVLHEVELYPIPLYDAGYPYTYQKAVAEFDGKNTSAYPLPWVSEDAIIAGAKARALRHAKDYLGAQTEAAIALGFRQQMVGVETRRVGPSRLVMASRFTQHRKRRWTR